MWAADLDRSPSDWLSPSRRARSSESTNTYDLPYANASFDAVFAHFLLGNVHEPLRAAREFRRVLRPGGVVGVLDTDWGFWILEPTSTLLQQFQTVLTRAIKRSGSSPYYARVGHQGTPARTRMAAENLEARLRAPAVWEMVLAEGWADLATLESMWPNCPRGPSGRTPSRLRCAASPRVDLARRTTSVSWRASRTGMAESL